MDDITRAVRTLYEAFPYPSGPPMIRVGCDARALLAAGQLARPSRGPDGGPNGAPIRVLDAGCSRGVGTLAAAETQPDVEFLGIDINRVALAEATRTAAERGLANVRFAEVDLMTLAGLDVPPGGFDVILSSGVVHHLTDPALGLALLAERLAPHGVLSLMVYGEQGRAPIQRVARLLRAALPSEASLAERLAAGRQLVAALASDARFAGASACPFRSALEVDDVEFVDRYLHVQEATYDVCGLWRLFEGAGLRFLRWVQPEQWSLERLPHAVRERVRALPAPQRFACIEELVRPGGLEVVLGLAGNRPRLLPRPEDLPETWLAVHPEVTFELATRSLAGATRIDALRVRRRAEEPRTLARGAFTEAGFLLRDQNLPFQGADLIRALAQQGFGAPEASGVLRELLELEVLYAPHTVDVVAQLEAAAARTLSAV